MTYPMASNSKKWVRIACDEALIKQGYRCFYCDSKLSRRDATADHYKAQAKHGLDDKENIVAACFACNQAKGSLHGDDFKRLLRKDPKTARPWIKLRAAVRRIELASQASQKRILALVGLEFDRSAP